ncbi:unnamed protein product [Caenorhabditis sp. 36 PRJEB53466]|nr:unnamed protein product [Caenorhabditis sp. 36 PRJEB53466]
MDFFFSYSSPLVGTQRKAVEACISRWMKRPRTLKIRNVSISDGNHATCENNNSISATPHVHDNHSRATSKKELKRAKGV